MANEEHEFEAPVETGGVLITFRDGVDPAEQRDILAGLAGNNLTSLSLADEFATLNRNNAILFEDFGIGYAPGILSAGDFASPMSLPESGSKALSTFRDDPRIESIEPEYYAEAFKPPFSNTSKLTWGIDAVKASASAFTGKGINVAILDTGFDRNHPDFVAHNVVGKDFANTGAPNDMQGHGTHCAGTAVGHVQTSSGSGRKLRYGVAYEANLYVGKVLNNNGFGNEADIIAGMYWAIGKNCQIISMSLGRRVRKGERHSAAYEKAARSALSKGCLVIAAAGNDSDRRAGRIAPVGAPANSPSVLAVAAVDSQMDVADFSCGGVNTFPGSQIDIAAPGVSVLSSFPVPMKYRSLSGTSMACPHVAGVAALWAESDRTLRGNTLRSKLIQSAKSLSLPKRDVGAGLVQAP